MSRRSRGQPTTVGLGIGARFALIVSGVGTVLIVLYGLVIFSMADGAMSEKIDRDGLAAVRALAAGGRDAWFTVEKGGKSRAVPGSQKRLERLIQRSEGQILNAFVMDNKKRVLAQYFKVGSFSAEHSTPHGLSKIETGDYVAGSFRARVRMFSTAITNERNLTVGTAHILYSEARLAEDLERLRNFVFLMGLLVLAVLIGTGFVLSSQITGPLRTLVQAVSRVNRGNLHYKHTLRRRDELGQLSRAIESMVEGLALGEEAHERLAEHEEDLRGAAELQAALLPTELPSIEGFEVAATSSRGTEGVADFYDAVPLADGGIALVVATCSGRGAIGAQVAAMARTSLRTWLESGADAASALKRCNASLAKGLRHGVHVTAQLAVLDPLHSRATVFIAGHRAPFYSCRRGDVEVVHGEGLALGLDRGPVFDRRLEEVVVEMPPGTRIVMTTVGTYDFETDNGKRFGIDNFQSLVRKHAPKNTGAFLHLILGTLDGHTEEIGRPLDAILVTAKRMT